MRTSQRPWSLVTFSAINLQRKCPVTIDLHIALEKCWQLNLEIRCTCDYKFVPSYPISWADTRWFKVGRCGGTNVHHGIPSLISYPTSLFEGRRWTEGERWWRRLRREPRTGLQKNGWTRKWPPPEMDLTMIILRAVKGCPACRRH